MPTIPAEQIERNRKKPDVRYRVWARPANHVYDGEEARCFAMGGGR